MPTFYKPNNALSGNAISFSINSKTGKLYVNLVKQSGPQMFKGGKQFSISFNSTELGGLLNLIERNAPFKAYHKSDKGEVSINAAPYVKKDTEIKDGITLSVVPKGSETKFGFWFNANEARLFRSYIEFVLEHIFSAEYAEQKKQAKDRLARKEAQQKDPEDFGEVGEIAPDAEPAGQQESDDWF